MIKKDKYFKYFVYFSLLIGALFSSLPVIWISLSSLKSNLEIFSYPPSILPKYFLRSVFKHFC